MTTNYRNCLITASPDSTAQAAVEPRKPDSIAGLQHGLLSAAPYRYTSDELLFEVHARRHAIPDAEREAACAAFLARSQACLRTSPLVKSHGWGVHHDENEKVALLAIESAGYARLKDDPAVEKVAGVRSKRAR